MTNAVFITGPLPLKREDTPVSDFEAALIDYLSFYSPSRTAELVLRLQRHDFTSVAAHFISSVPGKFEGNNSTKWGLGRLQKILQDVEVHQNTQVFAQVFPRVPSI
jgi:Tyrosyl-DNA phosphodiesterase